MFCRSHLSWVFLTSLLLVSSAHAQEWTRFRGPNGTGLSNASIPAKWADKDFLWKLDLPGTGHSSPVLWGDKLFITCCDEDTATRKLLCLDAATGAILWKREYPSHAFKQHGDNSYASSTPTVDVQRVYCVWSTPEALLMIAVTHDGKDAWQANLGSFSSQHGGGQSPIVVGDTILIGDDQEGKDSFLFGLDRANGEVRWKKPRRNTDKFSPATPCVFEPKEGKPQVIFVGKAEGLSAVDPDTGNTVWQLGDVFDSRPIVSPFLAGNLVFGACGDGTGKFLVAAHLSDDGTTAKVAYTLKQQIPYVPTPIVKGNLLFLWSDTGIVTCLQLATGEKLWQEKVGGTYYSSPVCANDKLFAVSKKGEVVVIAAAEKFELLARNPLDDKCHATPAIAAGRMYLRTFSHLYCISDKHGVQ